MFVKAALAPRKNTLGHLKLYWAFLVSALSLFMLISSSAFAQSARVNHQLWDRVLQSYVVESPDGLNRVDYAAVQANAKNAVNTYIRDLTRVNVNSLSPAEQMAFWMNLYNAVTIKVVIDEYPVKSIKDIGGLLSFGPWKKKRVNVGGTDLSLDDIEHGILRKQFRDPRIHYGVNCASVGCPNLQNRAFTGQNLQSLLNKGAVEYVNSSRGAIVQNGELTVSSIYSWFQEDFGGNDRGVIEHMKQYAKPALRQQLDGITEIADDAYDWSLNDTR